MKCFGATDKGFLRKMNQDSYIIAYNEVGDVLAAVADGIGGGNYGEIASQESINYLAQVFQVHRGFKDDIDIESFLNYHIRKANELVYVLSTTSKKYQGMGTTLTGILITKHAHYIFNIGDSRVYGVKHHQLRQLTNDHNLYNELLRSGKVTPQEACMHPKAKSITNALGIWASVNIDLMKLNTHYDVYLICSDGLFGYVDEQYISNILVENEPVSNKGKKLMQLALAAGGYDNITEILIQMEKGAQDE